MPSTGIQENIPRIFFLSQNFPNPFLGRTVIEYGLPKKARVRLCIYNAVGQLVGVLDEGDKQAGYYKPKWSGRDDRDKSLPSGIYFIRMTTAEFTKTRKMILIQ